jgi:Cu(I)/Ag(I) efflux system membrane protein CusA/SilA
MITSTIHVLILVPVFFVMMKERALRGGGGGLRNSKELEEDTVASLSQA